ncbi:MAG: sulfotransferase [Candidatus Hydrogenedentota bacterium]
MLFVISSPRSGSTMLERMLESHSQIKGGPEPHLLTPLAHLGVWDNVEKAPYDHVLAAESQKMFVEGLPKGVADYWDACRAYCDVLYGRWMESSEKTICLDKTPAYGLILPFMAKVFPDAKFVVLTRHPLATFSSFANSFFDGDYEVAQQYNPLLNRYVPALAAFLRQTDVPFVHVRYEDLVSDPEASMKLIYDYIGVDFEAGTIDYGSHQRDESADKGLGDPIGVQQHSRPSTESVEKWAEELSADGEKLSLMQTIIGHLDATDLETIGYPAELLWQPLENATGKSFTPKKQPMSRYRLQRKVIIKLRGLAQSSGLVRGLLKKVRLVADVLLRE